MMIPSRDYGEYPIDEECEEELEEVEKEVRHRSIFKRNKNKGSGRIIQCEQTKQDQELIDHSEKLVDLCFVVLGVTSCNSSQTCTDTVVCELNSKSYFGLIKIEEAADGKLILS